MDLVQGGAVECKEVHGGVRSWCMELVHIVAWMCMDVHEAA
jgi:hypothetical protein